MTLIAAPHRFDSEDLERLLASLPEPTGGPMLTFRPSACATRSAWTTRQCAVIEETLSAGA